MDCTVGKITEIMNEIAPEEWAEEWDNVGLILGGRKDRVKRLMIVLDITPAVIEEAVETKVDMIISHHPLIFKPFKSLDTDSNIGLLIVPLITHGIAVYCAHTNLDKAKGGVDDSLAGILDLQNIRPLHCEGEYPGFGRIGELPVSMDLESYIHFVGKQLKTNCLNFIGKSNEEIKTVAVCGGSGADFIPMAQKAGVDLFVTGEIKYHDALDFAFSDIGILTAGHFNTELPAMEGLIDRLQITLDALQYKVEVVSSSCQRIPYICMSLVG